MDELIILGIASINLIIWSVGSAYLVLKLKNKI